MNAISSRSSGAGSRADVRRALAVLALALAACGPKGPPTAETIALQRGDFPRIASIETQRYVADDPQLAANSGVLSAGRFIYNLGPPDGGEFKVKVLLFKDELAAQAYWQGMHRAEALAATTPLAAGDQGWIYGDEMAATREGRSIFEIKARGAKGRLADFTKACAAKAARRLRG
jgi:hypothetical protein